MQAVITVDVDVAGILVALSAFLVGIPALVAAVASRRVQKKTEVIQRVTDTGNGKSLGETVHDTSQTVELQAALLRTNTREILEVQDRQARSEARLMNMEELLRLHIAEGSAVRDEVREWIRKQQEKEG